MTPLTNLRRETSLGVFPSIFRSELSAMLRNNGGERPRRALSIHGTYRQRHLLRAETWTLLRLGLCGLLHAFVSCAVAASPHNSGAQAPIGNKCAVRGERLLVVRCSLHGSQRRFQIAPNLPPVRSIRSGATHRFESHQPRRQRLFAACRELPHARTRGVRRNREVADASSAG
jgi:hypothetical protein